MANYDDEQKALQEKRELLKLKQGLIEEEDSELLAETPTGRDYEKPTGFKRVENFFYHYKVPLIVGILVALALGYMIFDTVTKEKEDLYVLAVSTTNESGLYVKQFDIERALEQYCPDFDGNGYVHVGVNFINISEEAGVSQYSDAEHYKFSSEMFTGDGQLILSDEGFIPIINEMGNSGEGFYESFFLDLSKDYPDMKIYQGRGLQLNQTDFTTAARWESCPDTVGIYIRGEFESSTSNTDEAAERRERARIVLDNIAKNNVVNPPKENN